MRLTARLPQQQPASEYPFPSPVRGLIENENLARNRGVGASVMENWYPLQSTVRLRGGAQRVATIGSDPVLSLIPYQSTVAKLFAASASAVYDITALNPTTAPAAAFSNQGGGDWSHVQFGTAGGTFLVMANGVNDMRLYDGAAWTRLNSTSTPAITGVATSALSRLWMHGNRIWAIEKNTLNAWYLPIDSIAGVATQFALGGVFVRGGWLVFGAAWSVRNGDSMEDQCIFVTSQGEVAVYAGTNPASAATWALVGRYDMAPPVGAQFVKAGGDVLIPTEGGVVPLSAVMQSDPAALGGLAVSAAIEPSWMWAVRTRAAGQLFTMMKWRRESMMLVGLPHRRETFVCNMQTGAWTKFTGWDVQSMVSWNGLAYFGASNGKVYQIEGGGSDDGTVYVCRLQLLPDHMRAPGREKTVHQARATFRALAPFEASLSAATDYEKGFPLPPPVAPDNSNPALWDVGSWDVSRWDDGPMSEQRQTVATDWQSIGVSGFSISPQVQVSCGTNRIPDAELVALDTTYSSGGMVV